MTDRRVAMITGAGRGIGAATARELARRGYDLALLDIEADALDRVAAECRDLGAVVHTWPGDLADLEYVHSAVTQAAERFGRLDLLVNNAAWRKVETMRQTDVETWDRTLRICLTAPAFLAKWAAEVMEKRGRGVIVSISSIRSMAADGTAAAYVACKGAIDSLTYELASLYGPRGVRVLAVNPGAIDTDLSADVAAPGILKKVIGTFVDRVPLGRMGKPEEIARLIALLASDDASYVSGTTVVADGGFSRNCTSLELRHEMDPEQF
jgi:NAD(P)-dependent dehydrogenase (short-subunit alcohol dehydrogenase family)